MPERIPHADTEVRQAFQRMEARVSGGADPGHTHSIYLLADGSRDLTGNLAIDALVTIDGRDLSVDGTKLDGIEALADITDAANVAAAGAAMVGGAHHDGFSDFVAAEHVSLPSTIAAILTDHNLAAHTALGLFDQHTDVDHDQTTNTHNLTTDIDHASITGTHNLTTDIDHDSLTNTHNLTTDIDHNQLTNYVVARHIDWTAASDNFATSGTVSLTPGSTSVLIRDSSGDNDRLAIQGQNAGNIFIVDLYAKDGDASDNVGISVFGKGTPTDWVPYELCTFQWDAANAEFAIKTAMEGFGAATRALSIYTYGNRGQLFLAKGGGIILSPASMTHDIYIRDSAASGDSGRLAIQNLTSGTGLVLDLYTADGDGTDDMGLTLFAVGSPSFWTNYEILNIKWDASESEFILRTAAGGSGTLRPMNFFTEGNSGQLKLLTDGSITMAGALAVIGNITGPNVSSGENPGHTHTGTSLSAIDISDDTNLAATAPIILTDDTLSLDYEATDFSVVGTTLTITNSGIDHDATTNYDANKHVDHTGVSISTSTGLTGGGTIASTRTLSLSHLGIESLSDPGADRILFWDDGGTATGWLTVSTGLDLTTTNLTLSHLGIEALSDPGGDRILFWDDGETACKWLEVGDYLTLSGTSLTCRPGLTDRGQVANWDFEGFDPVGDFICDDDYHDLDLSSIVPAGAYAAFVRIQISATATNQNFFLLEKGTSVNRNMMQMITQAANVYISAYGYVKLDANRKLEYWASSGLDVGCFLCVRGWMI